MQKNKTLKPNRKQFIFFFILLILTPFISLPAWATTVTLIPDNPTPPQGDVVCIDVNVENVTNLYATSFDVVYDPAKLDYQDTTEGTFLNQDGQQTIMLSMPQNGLESTGKLVVGVSRIANVGSVSGSGTLATICFQVDGDRCLSSDITFSNVSLELPEQGNQISAAWNGTTITTDDPNNTYYRDADGDLYGDPDNSTLICPEANNGYNTNLFAMVTTTFNMGLYAQISNGSPQSGYVKDNTDCDDNDPFTHPGAPELCDGKDNDCDEIVPSDEVDNDLDGYKMCANDCNDSDETIHPGALELCDQIDNDCNPDTDDGADEEWRGDACDSDADTDLCEDDAYQCVSGAKVCSEVGGNYLEAYNQSVTTNEDTPLAITMTAATTTPQSLAFNIITVPSHGNLSGSAPEVTYIPDTGYYGPDSFTFLVTNGQCASNTATVSIYVNAKPIVEAPEMTTVQYSNEFPTTFIISASDPDSINLSIVSVENLPNGLAFSSPNCSNGSPENCTWDLEGVAMDASGLYNVKITVSDSNGATGMTLFSINVIPEDAKVDFDSGNPVAVQTNTYASSGGGDDASFDLTTIIYENDQEFPGDICLANVSVSLAPIGPGKSFVPITCTQTVTPAPSNETCYGSTLTVTCSFDDVDVNIYTVQATVNGNYYAGYAEDVIVVYDPSLGFATGGGWLYWPGTEDPQTGYPGDRTNFGFTMKYNKKWKNLRGSLLMIRHIPDGQIYRIKSNALFGLSLGQEPVGNDEFYGWASFSGKATYLEPGWSRPQGNHKFIIYTEGHNEPGTGVDRFWIEILDKENIPLSVPDKSMARPATDNTVPIQGGNIVIPHSGTKRGPK